MRKELINCLPPPPFSKFLDLPLVAIALLTLQMEGARQAMGLPRAARPKFLGVTK